MNTNDFIYFWFKNQEKNLFYYTFDFIDDLNFKCIFCGEDGIFSIFKKTNGFNDDILMNGMIYYNPTDKCLFLSSLTYKEDNICISHCSNHRLISIFNPDSKTTRYIIDEINTENIKQQFDEYIEQKEPTLYNDKLDITFNDNGTINSINKCELQGRENLKRILRNI